MSPDPVTRSTRLAANAAAIAVVVYAVLWFATTQVRSIREVAPFAEDPWDAVASYAAIFLPMVAGATWIRSVRHRGAVLPPATAARIRWGAGLAVGIVLASVAADLIALATVGVPNPADGRIALISGLLAAASVGAAAAAMLLVRAAFVARDAPATRLDSPLTSQEPDIVDDLLALAEDVARPIGLGRPVGRVSAAIERFLVRSQISPRRHRFAFGVVLAVAAAFGFDVWHALVEGGWSTPAAVVAFGVLAGLGVLGIYLATLTPLRLLRPVGSQGSGPS
jgi:hypothetical protein